MNVLAHLRRLFEQSLQKLTDKSAEYATHVRPAQDAKFGDYQANCAMPLRKELGGNPRDIAQKIIDGLPTTELFDSVEIAGPGFINLRLSDAFIAQQVRDLLASDALGLEAPGKGRTMVIDFSSPNVAKPMHVGHLRSTIIGDALYRIHRALGWEVYSDNHLGDWGAQFGMLIYGWRHLRDDKNAEENPIGELARLYREVNRMAESDPKVAEAARQETAKLHEGDSDNLELWRKFMPWCLEDMERVYRKLGVKFDHQLGESFFQPMLADTVQSLIDKGLAVESEGAICVFFPDPTGKVDKHGEPVHLLPPAIIRKADGAFTYATTDLACIRYRVETFKPELIVYVVDDRQSDHFKQIFTIAKQWGVGEVELVHVAFGKIMGKDNKPYKTRSGGTVGLEDLLSESIDRARAVVDENSPDLSEDERRKIAEVVGPSAVKYADLSQNRQSDYVFDWDKMVSLRGNTSTYMQYAYARNRSIFRKGDIDPAQLRQKNPPVQLTHPAERTLALELLRYPETLEQAAADFKPNLLTEYLFTLANAYSGFFHDCPVLKAETPELRDSRLVLCELTARTIQHGLELLGIQTLERM